MALDDQTNMQLFKLRAAPAAKVSEISEATAASPVPPEERVNFHIGNPVQDERLVSAFNRIALGRSPFPQVAPGNGAGAEGEELEGSEEDRAGSGFLLQLIRKSAPYMPRGGYQRTSPNELVIAFRNWLEKEQADPLVYDLGEQTGVREIILATGGINEAFRVFLHAISTYLVHLPARFLTLGLNLPEHLHAFPGIEWVSLPDDDRAALTILSESLQGTAASPAFLAIGRTLSEETRRRIRQMALERPLMVIEANDAPNSASLAREAGMSQRVLRFLTPGIFSPALASLSTVMIAGNPDLVRVLEIAHFQLKGTPSAPEVELLSLLLRSGNQKRTDQTAPASPDGDDISSAPAPENLSAGTRFMNPLSGHTAALEERFTRATRSFSRGIEQTLGRILDAGSRRTGSALSRLPQYGGPIDPFADLPYADLYEQLLERSTDPAWQAALNQAFLHAFLGHHPEYDPGAALTVSGSSRTALGLLGFHCGIREVVTPDLSWTYEHCFPAVEAIPLADDLQLDVDAILEVVTKKVAADPHWTGYGAVALNNPHNATGQAFSEQEMRRLLQGLLGRGIFVIDDLAYQQVVPGQALQGPRTLRQLTDLLIRDGSLTEEHAAFLVTVHSVSKTDSLAGSRLAVVEIRHRELRARFETVNGTMGLNTGAMFLSYLFYRAPAASVQAYWRLRNRIFDERMQALETAASNLPAERNRFGIRVRRPTGSMYPLLVVSKLPSGLSLDWLSAGLARQGIGLLPLSAFARTEKGFEAGRKAFRLTLGGTDPAGALLQKTRRVLIDLNRMMAEEQSKYNRRPVGIPPKAESSMFDRAAVLTRARELNLQIREEAARLVNRRQRLPFLLEEKLDRSAALTGYLPDRLEAFQQRIGDRVLLTESLLARAAADNGRSLQNSLEGELYKDSLEHRQELFRKRLFDRTVHPTQMYSLQVESLWEKAIASLLRGNDLPPLLPRAIAFAIADEYAGRNVAIVSEDEGEELLIDVQALLAAETFAGLTGEADFRPFLSYWGDWDGTTRPSGQGHRLVASVLLENVRRMADLLAALRHAAPEIFIEHSLREEAARLDRNILKFKGLLDEITSLTNQLEHRYRGVLPFQMNTGLFRSTAVKLHLARDPLAALWEHNDRLERRMVTLRHKRKEMLQYYFSLNKTLRKALYARLPAIAGNIRNRALALEAVLYRDLLKRVVITPRIHQKLITAQDQFAIDTTVFNIAEINDIAAASGNPGMILALQISMSTSPDALIALDRKLRTQRESTLRNAPTLELPSVWLVPLFEDTKAVGDTTGYLQKLWDYALQSRRLHQDTRERFTEILPEVFIAGSDLSQQVGQTAGAAMFREAKYQIVAWLAERGLVGVVRIKMGSGEPMQRQGGYYAPQSGLPAFRTDRESAGRLARSLPASVKKSTEYATTPLMGVFAAGDLRTVQSNLAEAVRSLPVASYAQLLLHMMESQRFFEREITRAAEPLVETRLRFASRGLQELERLTVGRRDRVFDEFVNLTTENFRQIIYGKPEDVVGLHIVSYFIARTTPPLRDRPTVRPGRGSAEGQQILERIAETVPLSTRGSLLRAIAHNQAQTAVLGVNQLTTGLFRALDLFGVRQFPEGTGAALLAERVLPNLPVYEILQSLRLYHDGEMPILRSIEHAFPAANSALTALREDLDAMEGYLGVLRRELIRRHGLSVGNFFDGDAFRSELLPTVRPDLAVLLQPDLFNTDPEALLTRLRGPLDPAWEAQVRRLLEVPGGIRLWRERAWKLLREPVFSRVQSFIELALALSTLSGSLPLQGPALHATLRGKIRQAPARRGSEDTMRQFLGAALEYLTEVSTRQFEVPTTVVKALQEVERIMKIEEQALPPPEQEELRCYLLQIARLAGENG